MPLVRFQLRNEYGLGDPELYKGAARKEDPKAVLDGVAVAGLVGILRQLGDLAELAAEIFQDLHEQMTATAARGQRTMARIRNIEEALPSIEKAVKAQNSHIHFAYIPGSDWHSSIQVEHDHLRHTDLPRFIMDSYEECHDPPRLFLLDKFDSAGPGSGACLRRYSDPTYFKRVCASLEPMKAEKGHKVRKIRKSKKRISRLRGDAQHIMSLPHRTSSIQCTSPGADGQSIAAETLSTCDMRLKSEYGSRSTSFDSRTRFSFVEPVLDINSSIEVEDQADNISSASVFKNGHIDAASAENKNVENADADDEFYNGYLENQSALGPPSATWDEKTEILKPMPKSRFLIDAVLDVTSPASEEPECNEVSAHKLRDNQTDAGGSSKPEESNVVEQDEVDDDGGSHQDSLPEQNTPSSIMWDEKAEITRPMSPHLSASDLVATTQDSDSHSSICEPFKQDAETSVPGETDKEEVLIGTNNVQSQFSGCNHFDEVISEAENFTDALNTLESETETDSEFQTKRELMPPPNPGFHGAACVADNMQDMDAPSSGSSDLESSTTSHISLNKGAPLEMTLVSSGSVSFEHPFHENAHSGYSIDNGHEKCSINTSGMSTSEAVDNDHPSHSAISNSEEALDTEITTTERQKFQVPKICDEPIAFWTNGGLLGLEPSKPPDFSIVNVRHETSVPNSQANGHDLPKSDAILPNESKAGSGGKGVLGYTTSHSADLFNEVIAGGTHNVVSPFETFSPFHCDGLHNVGPVNKSQECIHVLSKPELHSFQGTQSNNILANCKGHDLAKADVASHDCGSLVSLNGDIPSGEHGPVKIGVSSLTSLTRRLLTNSLQRKESFSHSDTCAPPGVMGTNSAKLQNISIPSVETLKLNEAASRESPESKPPAMAEFSSAGGTISSSLRCSSPPLEHMKISFHPMNGLETSKLRLEFPDSHMHESIEELMFPSFQLLPGPTIPLHGTPSESDDDTFCRSCPYSSEDVCSPHSDSNSELWAQDEISGCENHDIHDDSRRFSSSTASVSSSLEPEGRKNFGINQASNFGKLDRENGIIDFQSGPCLDLPNLDSLKSFVAQREKCDSNIDSLKSSVAQREKYVNYPLSSLSHQPAPPPLPPLQWRIMRPFMSVKNNRHVSNEVNHSDDQQFMRSTAVQPERQVPWPPRTGETGYPDKSTKLSGYKDLKQASKVREPDEREDLLYQIRNKSFNLRPTVTSRPSLVPRSTTNVKVAAILEKANAIRQAVASSDEGGDENWSDN